MRQVTVVAAYPVLMTTDTAGVYPLWLKILAWVLLGIAIVIIVLAISAIFNKK